MEVYLNEVCGNSSLRLRLRSITNRGFLPSFIITCNGWTRRGGEEDIGNCWTAPMLMYSEIRSETEEWFSSTVVVLL